MKRRKKRSKAYDVPTGPPAPPYDWQTLLDWLEWRDEDSRRWERLRPEQRARAEEFEEARARGDYGSAWQSASERARQAKAA